MKRFLLVFVFLFTNSNIFSQYVCIAPEPSGPFFYESVYPPTFTWIPAQNDPLRCPPVIAGYKTMMCNYPPFWEETPFFTAPADDRTYTLPLSVWETFTPGVQYCYCLKNAYWAYGYNYGGTFKRLIPPPQPPVLYSPLNNELNLPHDLNFVWYRSIESLDKLEWNLLSSGKSRIYKNLAVTNYWFELTTDTISFSNLIQDTSLTDTVNSVSGLLNLSDYYWRVKAKNEAGWGAFSSWNKFSTGNNTPALNSPLNGESGLSLTPLLDWADENGASQYKIQVSLDSLFASILIYDSTSQSQYNIPAGVISANTKNYWRVAVKDTSGWGSFSNPWNFTTLNNPQKVQLSSPANDSANAPVDLNFTWFKPSETLAEKPWNPLSLSDNLLTISQYWFELTTDTVSMAGLIADTTLTDTTKSISGLSYSTVYYWRVKGKNETGWGTFSDWWKFTTTNGIPLAPVLLAPVNRKTDVPVTPLMDWSDVSGAVKYYLQISPYADFHLNSISDSNITQSQFQVPEGYIAYNSGQYWRVSAKSIVGWGPYSTRFIFYTQIIPPPLAPVLVSPLNNSIGISLTPLLDWNDVSGAVKYKVQISTDTAFTTFVVNDSTPVVSSYTVGAGLLASNTLYYWRVSAKNSMYWGNYSSRWNFTTVNAPSKVILDNPKNDSLNAPADILFTWFKPGETILLSKTNNNLISKESPLSILSYDLEITTDTVSLTGLIRDTTIADTSKFINGLSYSSAYYWRVRAKNEVSWGQYSDWWHFTTESEIPLAPVLLSPLNNSTGSTLIPLMDWSDVVNCIKYKIQISLDSNFSAFIYNDSTLVNSEYQVIAGLLSANTKYFWRASAKNSNSWGPYSEIWNFTTLGVPQKVVLFSPPDDTTNQPINLTFLWYKAIESAANPFSLKNLITKKSGLTAVSDYWFELAIDTLGFTRIILDSTLTDTSKSVTGLNYTDEYFWRVKAKNEAGWGEFSGWWNFATGVEIVNPPSLVSPLNGASGITLIPLMDWEDVSGAMQYKLQIAVDSLFTNLIFYDSTLQSQYNISQGTLSACTKYYWRVSVEKSAGWSLYSTAWNFTTICVPQQIILSNPPNNSINQPINIIFKWFAPSEGAAASIKNLKKTVKENKLFSINNYWFELTSDTNTLSGLIIDSTLTDTSKIQGGFSYLTDYYWRVKAKNEAGWGAFGLWWKFTTQSNLPGVPVLLSPPNQAANISVTPLLDWSNVNDAIQYKVQVSPFADFHVLVIYDTTLISSEYQVTEGLAYNSGYFWRAAAKNNEAWGNYSAPFRFFTLLFPPPNPPALLSPANNSINITLTPLMDWSDVSGASLYRMQLSTDSLFTTNLIFDSTASSELQVPSSILQYLTTYYWRVGAKNTSGWGNYSSVWKFTTTPGTSPPPAPTLLSPVNNQQNIPVNPLLDWNDISGVLYFKLQISVYADFHTLILNDSSLTSSQYQVNSGLAYNSGYFWRVQAKNINGWGSYSSIFRFFTSITPPPPAPSLVSPPNNSVEIPTAPSFDWSDVVDLMKLKENFTNESFRTDDITIYKLQISDEPTFTTGLIFEDTAITGSQYDLTEGYLMWTSKYYWRVCGKNASGWGSYSSVWTFTTITDELPPAPVLLSPVNRATEVPLNPLLDWNDALTASAYRLQISTNRYFTNFVINDSTITSSQFQVSGVLAYNSGYYWRVQSKNVVGWGNFSTVFVFYTQITPPPAPPALISPPNNSIGISLTPLLDWADASGATKYCVQVSNVSNFNTLIVNDTTAGISQYIVGAGNLNLNTNYYWRVAQKNATTWGTFSAPWSFRTTTGAIEPPVLISPHNNDTGLTVYPLLDWSDVGGAIQYRVQVSAFASFAILWIDSYVPASQLQVTGGLAYNSGYFWRVKSFSGTDSSAYSSAFRFFTLRYPPINALNKPELSMTLDLSEYAGTKKKIDAIEISTDTSFSNIRIIVQDINSDNVKFSTSELDNFTSYYWRVKMNTINDAYEYSPVKVFVTGFIKESSAPVIPMQQNNAVPEIFSLHQNYPNPFNAETIIRYDLPKESYVRINLYDITGKEIKVLVDGYHTAGYYSVHLKAENHSSGIYFYRITASEFSSIKKLVLVK